MSSADAERRLDEVHERMIPHDPFTTRGICSLLATWDANSA